MIGRSLFDALLFLFAILDAAAHHSRATFYDSSQVVETEGAARYRNTACTKIHRLSSCASLV